MADLRHIRTNRLREEDSKADHYILAIGGVLAVIMLLAHPPAALACTVVTLIIYSFVHGANERRRHGAAGEERALGLVDPAPGALATLPDDYTVFNQVVVPLNNASCEIDFVVVGPSGVFAIEVKHQRGTVSGAERDAQWKRVKTSHYQGNAYEAPIRNPVSQIKRAIHALKKHLVEHGTGTWVQGIVVFTHPDCELNLGETSVPVLRLEALAAYIRAYRPARPLRHRAQILSVLMTLTAPAPQGERAAA